MSKLSTLIHSAHMVTEVGIQREKIHVTSHSDIRHRERGATA